MYLYLVLGAGTYIQYARAVSRPRWSLVENKVWLGSLSHASVEATGKIHAARPDAPSAWHQAARQEQLSLSRSNESQRAAALGFSTCRTATSEWGWKGMTPQRWRVCGWCVAFAHLSHFVVVPAFIRNVLGVQEALYVCFAKKKSLGRGAALPRFVAAHLATPGPPCATRWLHHRHHIPHHRCCHPRHACTLLLITLSSLASTPASHFRRASPSPPAPHAARFELQ